MNDKYSITTDYTKINKQQWNIFVVSHPQGNIFQSPEIYSFFQKSKQYDPIVICAQDSSGNITGVLSAVVIREAGLAGFFSARCIVWGGPLVINNDTEIIKALLKKLDEQIGKKVIYTEFRNFCDTTNFRNIYSEYLYKYKPYLNYIITIGKEEILLKNIKAEKRRQIRKSIKNGAEIVETKDINRIKEFYNILTLIYSKKVKKPLPSFNFFHQLLNQNLAIYLLIIYKSKVIGGACLLKYINQTVYDWYRGGLDYEYKHLYPSTVAVWAGLQYAIKNNYKYYDFMGAGEPNKEYGVRNFKSQFGGDLVEYGRYIRINKPVLYAIGKVGVRVMGWIKKVTG